MPHFEGNIASTIEGLSKFTHELMDYQVESIEISAKKITCNMECHSTFRVRL